MLVGKIDKASLPKSSKQFGIPKLAPSASNAPPPWFCTLKNVYLI
jgi:hypothetical protein